MAPEQVRILPIGDEHADYAYSVKAKLMAAGIRVEVDDRNETIGKKIRNAQLEKLPYMLVIGENEMNAGTVAVRSRRDGDKGVMSVEAFLADIKTEIDEKRR
jgi:threonyl-tRNA synthetase